MNDLRTLSHKTTCVSREASCLAQQYCGEEGGCHPHPPTHPRSLSLSPPPSSTPSLPASLPHPTIPASLPHHTHRALRVIISHSITGVLEAADISEGMTATIPAAISGDTVHFLLKLAMSCITMHCRVPGIVHRTRPDPACCKARETPHQEHSWYHAPSNSVICHQQHIIWEEICVVRYIAKCG